MNNKYEDAMRELAKWYKSGQVFAYPTEAVYGIGCDPLNKEAVYKILALKSRSVEKGMILIASNFSQIAPYVVFDSLPQTTQDTILASWPGPVTWLLPKSSVTPDWVSGDSSMIAVRITKHPLVRQMCDHLNAALISTSANPAGESPAMTESQVRAYFSDQVSILAGQLGTQNSPSKIFHSLTMETIRA